MSADIFPTWAQKCDAVLAACAWATGVCGEWAHKADAFQLPEDNTAWFTLSMGRIRELGVDDVCYLDNGVPVGGGAGAEYPRQDVIVGQRRFFVELRTFNRDQEQDVVAWYIADRARTRLRLQHVRDRFLNPVGVTVAEMFEVVPMPTPLQIVSMRVQSEAVLEMDLATTIEQTDGAAIGTWIERTEISSTLKNPGGVPLDPSIQLDNEVMP